MRLASLPTVLRCALLPLPSLRTGRHCGGKGTAESCGRRMSAPIPEKREALCGNCRITHAAHAHTHPQEQGNTTEGAAGSCRQRMPEHSDLLHCATARKAGRRGQRTSDKEQKRTGSRGPLTSRRGDERYGQRGPGRVDKARANGALGLETSLFLSPSTRITSPLLRL